MFLNSIISKDKVETVQTNFPFAEAETTIGATVVEGPSFSVVVLSVVVVMSSDLVTGIRRISTRIMTINVTLVPTVLRPMMTLYMLLINALLFTPNLIIHPNLL